MAKPVRRAFVAGEQTVYEWEQTLEEVMIFIYPPEGVRGKDLDIKIEAQHIKIGIKGNPPFIEAPLEAAVSVENSLWTLEDGELNISLAKARVGETWKAAIRGHETLDAAEQEREQKNAMLERFQRENPQFDFSSAEFNGAVPDAREFMGGISRSNMRS